MSMKGVIRLGTRGSMLALTQSRWVAARLEELGWQVDLEIIKTSGDVMQEMPLNQPDVKGLFVREIEQALLERRVDLAVHSMKDLPGETACGLTIGAVPKREDVRDTLVCRDCSGLVDLPRGAVIGSSSPRRKVQLQAARPDLVIRDIRGNVDTRLRKLDERQFHAICLAAAGLNRLGLSHRVTQYLDLDIMLPAACQGALALQVREDDSRTIAAIAPLNDPDSANAVKAESKVLLELGLGCSVPLGLLAEADGTSIRMRAALYNADTGKLIKEEVSGSESPEATGIRMADLLKSHGLSEG